jgi:hypothetical protein
VKEMGRRFIAVDVLILGVIFIFMIIGCHGTIKPTEEPPGITYQVTGGAQITKVSMYMKVVAKVPWCWVDVTVKNLTNVNQKFKVIVKVDDEPEVAVRSKKPIDSKKEDIISVMTLGKSLPRTVSLTVTN